jgi:transcriptional regulator with XRE-family HTH domain
LDETSKIIGGRLRDLRHCHGMTQENLAERADLSVAVIKKIESGGNARIQTYDRLARVLGVRTLWFEPETTGEAPHGDAGEAWARRLVEFRRARRWVESDVARELKKLRPGLPGVKSLTKMIHSDWESGKRRPAPRYRMLLAKVYDVDEDELFGDQAPAQPPLWRPPALMDEAGPPIETAPRDLKRPSEEIARRLDEALGADGALLALVPPRVRGLNPYDEERLIWAARRPSRIDLRVIEDLATILAA